MVVGDGDEHAITWPPRSVVTLVGPEASSENLKELLSIPVYGPTPRKPRILRAWGTALRVFELPGSARS